MQTCETCRHWERDTGRLDRAEREADCGVCVPASEPVPSVWAKSDPLRAAMVARACVMVTLASFGCIAHEPRE